MRHLPIASLTILPIQPFYMNDLEDIVRMLNVHEISSKLERSILRPRGAYDAKRHQLRAALLLERARSCSGRPVLAVTDADCYAGTLNFVFGMADVGGGAALVSLHRLRVGASIDIFRRRVMKEIVHELGHALGLGHCPDARCVMHFSNSLADTDAKSEQVCPYVCVGSRRLQDRRRLTPAELNAMAPLQNRCEIALITAWDPLVSLGIPSRFKPLDHPCSACQLGARRKLCEKAAAMP